MQTSGRLMLVSVRIVRIGSYVMHSSMHSGLTIVYLPRSSVYVSNTSVHVMLVSKDLIRLSVRLMRLDVGLI